LAAAFLPTLLWAACGQVYRPVVLPCSEGGIPGCPVEAPPTPANFHAVFAISTNAPNNPGGAMQIDVAGDSIIAETPTSDTSEPNLGDVPTHAGILPNDSTVFVASAGSVLSGGIDVLSSFTPASQSPIATGLGPVQTISLPSLPGQASSISALSEVGNTVTVTLTTPLLASPSSSALVPVGTAVVIAGEATSGYNGTFAITAISPTTLQYFDAAINLAQCPTLAAPCTPGGTASIPGQPVFLASTENTAMYVANYNSNSVSKINTLSNVVANAVTVEPPPPAPLSPVPHPVSMAETPNALKLYVANQGNNTVSSLNTVDLSANSVTGFTGINPVWVVARHDSQKVYVLTQGDGQLVTIDTATDTVTSSLTVGAGANFIFYDPHLNRLYVTNPVTSMVYVFSDTGGLSPATQAVSDIPAQLAAISFASGSTPCPGGCSPTSVAALADGSRFYVANYQTASSCPDPIVGASSACVIPGLTVFDANSLTVKSPNAPTLNLLTYPFAASQFAVPPVASCVSPALPALYAPGTTRFRVFTTAAADSTHVYVSMCDAGAVADINTSGSNTNTNGGSSAPADTLVTDLPTAFSSGPIQSNGFPANQNPIFMLTGQ